MRIRHHRRFVGLLGLLAVLVTALAAQDVYNGCPREGSAKRADARRLNVQKNRDDVPSPDSILMVGPEQFLLGKDVTGRPFRAGRAVRTWGYVADVRPGAVETCNCGAKDGAFRDTHIEIVAEVTPRFRAAMQRRGVDWSQRALRDRMLGRWVELEGWLFMDSFHADESANDADAHGVWRGTAWEVHPITAWTVLPGRPTTASTPKASNRCQATTKNGSRCSRKTTGTSVYCWQHR